MWRSRDAGLGANGPSRSVAEYSVGEGADPGCTMQQPFRGDTQLSAQTLATAVWPSQSLTCYSSQAEPSMTLLNDGLMSGVLPGEEYAPQSTQFVTFRSAEDLWYG